MNEALRRFMPVCPEGWKLFRIGAVLREVAAPIEMDNSAEYPLASIRRRNGGMFHRETLPGSRILTKTLHRIVPGSFVIARMQIVHGASALAPPEFEDHFISKSYTSFVGSEQCDVRYFAYLARQPFMYKYFLDASHGVVIEKMTFDQDRWLDLPICLPSLPAQRRIVEILDTIDEAIRISETVIAKRESTLAALSYEIFGVDEWDKSLEVTRLGQLLARSPKNGYSPVEASSWFDGWLLGLGCLTPVGFQPRQLKYAPQADRRLKAAQLTDGDLLMSRSNTREMVGLVGIYEDVGAPAYYPDLMMRLVPNGEVTSRYLELALRSAPARRQIETSASGTSGSMVKIGNRTVRNLIVPNPPRETQDRAVERMAAVKESITAERISLSKLLALRTGLAADLLSGQVRTVAHE